MDAPQGAGGAGLGPETSTDYGAVFQADKSEFQEFSTDFLCVDRRDERETL